MALKAIDGLPILNAKRTLELHVTQDDIDGSGRKEPNDCAVARACRRELHAREVRVHLGRVYIRTGGTSWTRYITPKPMRDEIIAFDRGGRFSAGEFVLRPPPLTKRTGKRQGSKTKPRTRVQRKAAPKRRPPTVVKNVRTGPASHYQES